MFAYCAVVILLIISSLCSVKSDHQSIIAIEDCPEVVGSVKLRRALNFDALQFKCLNPMSLITTLNNAMSLYRNASEVVVYSTCPTAKLAVSFFGQKDNVDVISSIESTDTSCLGGGRIFHEFTLAIIDAYELKTVVVLLDSRTASTAKYLQRSLNTRPIKSVVINLDSVHFDLDDALIAWSSSHNFLVFCNRANQIRLIQAADEAKLFGDPFFWIFEEDEEKNITEAFAAARVRYGWNVNIARILNNESQESHNRHTRDTFLSKRAFVTKVDFRNESEQKVYHPTFISWMSVNVNRKARIAISHFDDVLGYKLFRLHLKCFGAVHLELIGEWSVDSTKSFKIISTASRSVNLSLRGCHFRVGIVNNPPSVILADSTKPDTASGIDIDLLKNLGYKSEFTYELVATNDSSVGSSNESEWTGLIKSLLDREIDMILPSMAITAKRQEIMDFSTTIRAVSAAVVIKKPGIEDNLFSDYIQPFEKKVWMMIGLMLLATIIGLTFTHLYSPYAARMAPVNRFRRRYEGDLNWWNSFYVLYSILTQQGVDRTPTSISGKIVFGSFLLATVILMQNYSSLLVSFLTVNKPLVPFASLEDLTQSSDYSIGLIYGSSIIEVLSTSNEPIRKQLWNKIASQGVEQSMWPIDVALENVLQGKIALLIRSSAVHNLLLTNCSFHAALKDVIKVSYHMAFRKGFAYNSIISQHITRLRETGILDKLNNKYNLRRKNLCTNDTLSAITLGHVIFLLIILFVGFILTSLTFVLERLIHIRYGHGILNLIPGIVDVPPRRNMIHSKEVQVGETAARKENDSRMTGIYRYVIKVENLLNPQ